MSAATSPPANTITQDAAVCPAKADANGGAHKTTTTAQSKHFDMSLFQHITAGKLQNVLISPFLAESLLALLYLGADGSTAEELQRLLQLHRFTGSNAKMANYYATHLELNTNAASETRFELQSHIFLPPSQTSGDEFQQIAQKYFQTRVQSAQQSEEALQQLLSAELVTEVLEANDICVALTVLLHFKWFLPFSAYRSGTYDFHSAANDEAAIEPAVQAVPMLFDDDMFVKFGEFRELDARAIELPCEHETLELTMLIVLPNQRDGLPELLKLLCDINVAELTEQRMQMESVQVLLPKFKIDYRCALKTVLEELGISAMFSKLANFKHLASSTTQQESVKLANIWHCVKLEVNESGSAVSTVVANKPIVLSNSTRQKFFRADHPFYFAIRAGDVTYFAGQVLHCG